MGGTDRLRYTVDAEPGDVIVDNSIMSAVMKCSTLAALEYALHLKPKIEGAAMKQGQAGHAAVAEWLDTGGDVERAMTLYRKEFVAQAQPALDALPATDKDRERLSFPRTGKILRAWFEDRSPLDEWPLVVAPGDTELPISAPLMRLADGRRVVFVALIDALGKRRTGGLWSIDHKFRKGITDWWKGKQEDSSQFTGQKWLGQRWDLWIAGIYVNGIEIPTTKTSQAKCRDHGQPYVECDTKHARHELFPVTKTAAEIAAWRLTLKERVPRWIALKERVKSLEDIKSVPMEGRFNDSCTFCGFREWCRVGRPVGGRGDFFVTQQWDPLAERRSGAPALPPPSE